MENPKFLKQKYGNLHKSPEVQSAAERTEKRTGESVSENPEVRIQNYLNRFNEILNRTDKEDRQQGIEALKKVLTKELVIKAENVPYRAFELEQDIAEQWGRGRPAITEKFKQEKIKQIQEDQKESLHTWIDYLTSPDAMYPDWAKYWAFRSMAQMGGYSKKDKKFGTRKKDTVHAFPTLNAGCLADTIGHIQQHVEIAGLSEDDPQRIDKEHALMEELGHNEETRTLLTTENFAKIYTHYLEQFGGLTWENLENIKGYWKKYEHKSDPQELVDSLKGYPLEWCTRNISTARTHLEGGDFYVYYSQNNDGEAVVPRLAMRMRGTNTIAEVRGIEKDQNIDQYIQPVLDEKLSEFGSEGERYLKKSEDMKRMTDITQRYRTGQALTSDDLRFLYEIDGNIQGFGYKADPRIKEILDGRNMKEDLGVLFNCRPDQIAITQEEALSGDCVYYRGDLDLSNLTSAEGLTLPQSIGGYLYLSNLTSAEGLTLPQSIGGYLELRGLTSAEGLTLPQSIEGGLFLNGLTSADKEMLRQKYPQYVDKIK
ncbi:MAG: hypothetical protein LRY44_03050 [Candidatus Pacebacteria bacterium]|nr:hypothetical protein [Candidatus Paceibacterota bacterium]